MSLRFIHTGSVLRHQSSVTAACWASASLPSAAASSLSTTAARALLTASDDGDVGMWNGDGEWQGVLFSTRGEYGIIDLAVSPVAPELVAAACSDGALRLFSAAGGREEKRVAASAAGAAIISVRWSPDGSALVTGGEDGCVKVWSRAGALRTTLATCAGPVYAVRWGSDANTILWASGRDLLIASLTADAGGTGRTGKGGAAATATSGSAGAISWKAHDGVVLAADWCPTTGRIVSGGEDGRYKVWDSLGRLLSASAPGEHVVTSVAWSPSGTTFATGSHSTVRLCDAAGWSISRETLPAVSGASGAGGGVSALAWAPDGSVFAVGSGGGSVVLAAPTGRRELSAAGFEAVVAEPSRIVFSDAGSGGDALREVAVEFRERVSDVCVGFGHALVATPTQIHIFSRAEGGASGGWSAPAHVVDTPRAPTALVVQSSRGFAALDTAGAITVFTYDGRPVSTAPKLGAGTLRPELVSRTSLALAPDSMAILDRSDGGKSVRCYELKTGRALGGGPYTHPTAIVALGLSQSLPMGGGGSSGTSPFGSLAERRLALLDTSGDLYILPVTGSAAARAGTATTAGAWPSPLKIASMVDTFAWAETHDSLLVLSDGAALLWLWPHAASADAELAAAARVTLLTPPGTLGSSPSALTYEGSRAVFSRGDGARIFLNASPFAAPLHTAVASGRWEEAVRLARLARSPHVWAALAALALTGKQLDAAEYALAAAGAIDKLDFVRHIKKQVLPEVRSAELAVLLRRPFEEAEGTLLSATPPLIYRACKLNIRAGRWTRALEIAQNARAHIDTVLAYRARALAATGAAETLAAFTAANAIMPTGISDWPAIKARKDAEKAKEASRPGAAPLASVSSISWRGPSGERSVWA